MQIVRKPNKLSHIERTLQGRLNRYWMLKLSLTKIGNTTGVSNWGSPWIPPVQHSTIVLRDLRGPLIGSPLYRETPISRTANVSFFPISKCSSYREPIYRNALKGSPASSGNFYYYWKLSCNVSHFLCIQENWPLIYPKSIGKWWIQSDWQKL